MQKNCMQWVELFLHFADVSNPLKPFDVSDSGPSCTAMPLVTSVFHQSTTPQICKKWAWRVLDEFFEQGDEDRSFAAKPSRNMLAV